ncbi:MAG: 2Fe-2S iron-sulfur cluster-binding protein, partial [Thermodesulfobacteriota bacterium]|nr:2Fe-2S iron-sulfur cluster-binding protein [Thermodesulfobacteriota bacterium]
MDSITIDGRKVDLTDTISIFEAAKVADIYIPHLCSHPQLDPLSGARSLDKVYQGGRVHHGEEGQEFEGCNLCLVEIQGTEGLFRSCKTMAENGMNIITNSPDLKKARQDALAVILESHPHACLLCPQAEGCDRKVCSVNVPEQERCCSQFGNCELQKVAWFVGMDMGLPPYKPSSIDIDDGEPLILRNYSLCVGCLRCVNVCRDVRGADALGFVIEEGHVVVGSKEPTFRESGCQFCGFCVDVCPTGALTDRLDGVGERETLLIPCKNSCPAGIDVPRYVRLIGKRKYGEALAVIREKV